jgi:hypothetical protein
MKKTFKIIGWICLGIFIQFKFNALYGIVLLENLNFHDRSYIVKINATPTNGPISILNVDTIVHHSLGSDYFANVYIPEQYKVLNQKPYTAAESIEGYKAYQMNMKRKYRDVLDRANFIITPDVQTKIIPSLPILVLFENMNQVLHRDQTYQISTHGKKTLIEGPPEIEIKYPQKWGM